MTSEPRRTALEQLGRTSFGPGVPVFLLAFLLLILLSVPALEIHGMLGPDRPGQAGALDRERGASFAALTASLRALPARAKSQGLRRANTSLRLAMESHEDVLEQTSRVQQLCASRVQWALTATLGAGMKSVRMGRDGWLHYTPDIEQLTGRPFLSQQQRPDALTAIADLHRQLQARGIQLMVMPTPAKTAIHPELLTRRYAPTTTPLTNPSLESFKRDLERRGIPVFDPAALLVRQARETDRPQFLRTDSHWTPQAVERVAAALSSFIQARVALPPGAGMPVRATTATHEALGDLARMLELPRETLMARERITLRRWQSDAGTPWFPADRSPVLLLGDSFTNVYSDSQLGWGEGAGLGEQLSAELGQAIDVLAINDQAAHATREALAAEIARGARRLADKRVVIYQFANRELSSGDWTLVALPDDAPYVDTAGTTADKLRVNGVVEAIAQLPERRTTPYRDAMIALRLGRVEVLGGSFEGDRLVVYMSAMHDAVLTPAAHLGNGDRLELELVPWSAMEPSLGSIMRFELSDATSLSLPAYFGRWDASP